MEDKCRMTYGVDFVFCIDTGAGMKKLIDRSSKLIPEFCRDMARYMEGTGRPLSQMRARLIAFRNYLTDGEKAVMVTDFFDLPLEQDHFQAALRSLKAADGGDRPNDGMEALAYAIRSDWSRDTDRFRHVIVVLSNGPTHPLGFGKKSLNYPKGMANDFKELSAWWGSCQTPGFMNQSAKRLVLFTPYNSGWKMIANAWDRTLITSGDCCSEIANFHYFNLFFNDL